MYLAVVKSAVVKALQAVFDGEYPYEPAKNLHISIEFPIKQVNYPGIWVSYDDRKPVEVIGIDHREYIERADGSWGETTRWEFEGDITLTVSALSSYERDLIYDEIVRIVGFSRDKRPLSDFRRLIEQNDFVAMNANFDSLKPGGSAEAPGTPWGTEEYIYEKSVSIEVRGEFVGDPDFHELVLLRKVDVRMYRPPAENEPPFPDNPPDDRLLPPGTNPFPKNSTAGADGQGWV